MRDNVRVRKSDGLAFIHLIFVPISIMMLEIHRVNIISEILSVSIVNMLLSGMVDLNGENR